MDRIPTVRQREIATYMAGGYTAIEIAKATHITENTVRTHIQDLLRRTGGRNRVHAIAICIRKGWIE